MMPDITAQSYDRGWRAQWDEFVSGRRDASIYHHTWWMDVMARCFPHRNVSLLAADRDGRIRAVLPLFFVTGWRRHRLVSVPLRDQGGILGDSVGTRVLLQEAVAMSRREPVLYCALKQGGVLAVDDEGRENGWMRSSHWVTTELALPFGPKTTAVNSAALRNVRKAERSGVSAELGCDAAFANRFYRLFRETRKRLGVPTYSSEFFATLSTYPQHVTFILCSKDGRDLAGAVILSSSRKAAYAYAANSLFRRDLRGSDLVVWTAINWASAQKLSVFDFGADSPWQTELIRFKQKWGAQSRTLHHYYYLPKGSHIANRDHSSPQWKWLRRSVSLLPYPVFELLSRWAVARVD